MAHLTESINRLLLKRRGTVNEPMVVIIDFSLVLGIDSSAAQAMAKLKTAMQKQYDIQLSIFVSGHEDGFPCAFDLSKELSAPSIPTNPLKENDYLEASVNESTGLLSLPHVSSHDTMERLAFSGSHVCDNLNLALVYAENALIDRDDPSLLEDEVILASQFHGLNETASLAEERDVALLYLKNLCPAKVDRNDMELLFSKFQREVYVKDDYLWKQGSPGSSVKLLVRGTLIALLENEAGTCETIASGNTIGELGLVEGISRMSSVKCLSEEVVLYSLSCNDYEQLIQSSPKSARVIDLICVRYLSTRVQHVSNRIFETRCLPI
jgi:SulP family sulfate permease